MGFRLATAVNSAAVSEFFEDAEHVEVFYDDDENRLGLKPLEDETEDSYTLSIVSGSGSVTPTSFLKSKSLVPDVTTHYKPTTQSIDDDTELVVVDLDDPTGTYGEPDSDGE